MYGQLFKGGTLSRREVTSYTNIFQHFTDIKINDTENETVISVSDLYCDCIATYGRKAYVFTNERKVYNLYINVTNDLD